MIKDVYMIDKEGYYIDFVKINEKNKMYCTDSFKWSRIDFEYVETTPPIMCQPKWNGKVWMEGASSEELKLWHQPCKTSLIKKYMVD